MEEVEDQSGLQVSGIGGESTKRTSTAASKHPLKRSGRNPTATTPSLSSDHLKQEHPRSAQQQGTNPKRRFADVFPASHLPLLIAERQSRGRSGRFVAREGAGAWSPDPLYRSLGGSAHVLRRLELSGVLKGHRGCVNTVSCTPDGKYWITGSDDTMLMIWDCESHKRITSFPSGHTDNVFQGRALPYTGNEKIVTCAADGQVRLTSLSRKTSVLMGEHEGRAHRLAIEPGSPHRFMTCGEDGVVLEFDLRTRSARKGRKLLRQPGHRSITGMALNLADPNYLFVCGSSPFLDLYDARKVNTPAARYCPSSLRRSRAHITGCNANWCGSEVIATYNPMGEVYRFDVKKNAIVPSNSPWRGEDRSIRRRVEQPAASEAATTRRRPQKPDDEEDGEDYDDGEEEKDDSDDDDDDSSDDGGGDADREAANDDENPSYLTKFTGHSNIQTVKQVTFYGPRSEFVASGSDCGHIFIWDKKTTKLEMLLFGDKSGAVNCLEPHPFLPVLATSGLARTAKVWRPTRPVAVPPDKLQGKYGRPAGDIVELNAEHLRHGGGAQMPVTPEMILNILGMQPLSDEDDDDHHGTRQRRGGAAGGGSSGGAGARPGTPPHRRSLRQLLASIPSFRLVTFPRRLGVASDEISSDEVGGEGGEGGQEEDDDDEDDDEEEGGEGYWAGGDLMNDEGGEEKREVVDEGEDGERGGDDEVEEEEKEEGPGEERLTMEGPRLGCRRAGGGSAAAEAAGLSFEVVSSQSESEIEGGIAVNGEDAGADAARGGGP